jgi:precorrin-8X/cobalt-precorrin-8 methylmutase
MRARHLSRWPVPGGWLERLGLPPAEIEGRSRAAAQSLVGDRWTGLERELAAALVYASGDPGVIGHLAMAGEPALRGRLALDAGCAILVDVSMVGSGIRLPKGRRLAVAVRAPGVEALARTWGTTRAAAGMRRCWDDFGAGGVVVIGNAPTALLAVLDLAAACAPPACVIATCPGLNVAREAKAALIASGLPHATIHGTRGGSGLAAAALNFLLEAARE